MSTLTADSCLVRLPDLVAAEMDGDLVMMSIKHGKYFGISGVGTRVWVLLEEPTKLSRIKDVICQEFDIDEDRCLHDVIEFAGQLLSHGVAREC